MNEQPKKNETSESRLKWYQHKGFVFYAIVSLAASVVIFQQNYFIARENADIKHQLSTRNAYFTKGLIDGARTREDAYVEIRKSYERVLEHCKQNPCKLPSDLAVLPAERRFETLESILIKER